MLPPFEVVARRRPVALLGAEADVAGLGAPYVTVEGDLEPGRPATLILTSCDTRLEASYDGRRFALAIATGSRRTTHRSRRDGTPQAPVDAMALTLTGRHVTVHSRSGATWTARGRHGLRKRVDTLDERWLAGLAADGGGTAVRAGAFGQVGLRDLRVVTYADGTPWRDPTRPRDLVLSATSAGPGFFDTAHTSLWSLDLATHDLAHRGDLFFRRPDRPGVHGDHATHVVRDGDRWLVATSTWGDFDPRRRGATVDVTLAETAVDVTRGRHVLDTRALPLPTTGLRSVGTWDPHLVRDDSVPGGGWLVAYVSATRFFRFHPVLATGPSLDDLTLRAALDRRSTEGPTLVCLDGRWHLAASDGRDGGRGHRERYPVHDLDLREVGTLDATYPSNIPWPTLAQDGEGWVMVGFDGTPWGGRLVGYGSHGDVVVQRTREAVRPPVV